MAQALILPFVQEEWLDTPVVVVHRPTLDNNIHMMANYAKEKGVALRPHIKSHKTVEIARKQRMAGMQGLTVAKLGEAEVFVDAGFRDITVAYPIVSEVKRNRLMSLAARARVTTLVDEIEQVDYLAKSAQDRGVSLGLWIKIDTGLHRCGVPAEEIDRAAAVAYRITRWEQQWRQHPGGGVYFAGLLTHAGHVYAATSRQEVETIAVAEGEQLVRLQRALQMRGIPCPGLSAGSTPTAKHVAAVRGITEIRPGNYVFHDRTQVRLGVASWSDCALRVLARVVSRPAPGRCVIDAGSKTLALDMGAHGSGGLRGFGAICGYPHLEVTRLSEEHGIVETTDPHADVPPVGTILEIIPNHACPVVNLTSRLGVVGERGWEWYN
ncbi:MAG: alanine racemase, partial [Alicyclobacillaceae bacterium]|nr:alanine racemase [Alicyclobacillaceae bacterium]